MRRLPTAADCGMLKEMPGSMEFLRGVLALIGIGCAYMAARAWVTARKGWQKQTKTTGWLIRTVLCLAGVIFRHTLDALDIAAWILVAAAAVAGWWFTSHTHPPEDLTGTIFPEDQ
jgi:hypothetical protein